MFVGRSQMSSPIKSAEQGGSARHSIAHDEHLPQQTGPTAAAAAAAAAAAVTEYGSRQKRSSYETDRAGESGDDGDGDGERKRKQ